MDWLCGRGDTDWWEHVDLAVTESCTSNHGGEFVGVDALVLTEEGTEVLGKDAKIEESQELTRERTFHCQVFWELERLGGG